MTIIFMDVFFWKLRLCSYLLISHDGNKESFKVDIRHCGKSVRLVSFSFGIICIYIATGTLV